MNAEIQESAAKSLSKAGDTRGLADRGGEGKERQGRAG